MHLLIHMVKNCIHVLQPKKSIATAENNIVIVVNSFCLWKMVLNEHTQFLISTIPIPLAIYSLHAR